MSIDKDNNNLDLIQIDNKITLEQLLQDAGESTYQFMKQTDFADIEKLLKEQKSVQFTFDEPKHKDLSNFQFNEVEDLLKQIDNVAMPKQADQIGLPITEQDLLIENLAIQNDTQIQQMNELLKQIEDEPGQKKYNDPHQQEDKQQQYQYIIDYIDLIEKQPYIQDSLEHFESNLFQSYEILKQKITSFIEVKQTKNQKALYQQIYQKQTEFRIKCIDVHSNVIAIGTSKSSILFISDKIVKLEQHPEIIISPVISMKFSADGSYLVALTQQQILLYHKNKLEKVFNKIYDSTPLHMVSFNSNQKNIIFSLIICDCSGLVQLVKIRRTTFTYGIEKKPLFQGSFGICHQLDHAKQKKLEVISLAFKNSVLVIVVEPFIELVFKKQYQNAQRQLIQCKWQQNSDNPLLAIGVGNKIEILKMECKIKENGVLTNFEILNNHNLNQNDAIEYMTWLGDNALFVKTDLKRYTILSVCQFQGDCIIQTDMLSASVSEQSYSEDKIPSYFNSIAQWNNQLFYIEYQDRGLQNIIQYQFLDWLTYIQQLITNLDWNECLGICLQIYQGKNYKFYGIPLDQKRQDKLRPILQEKIRQYVAKMIELNQIKNVIVVTIDFLCNIDSFEFLFNDIRNIFIKYKLEQEFLDKLEPFILKNKIKYIPNEALKDVMTNLKQQRKLCTLKQLIINLDIQQLDSILIQQLCIEFNLFTPLIYISPRVDDDFKTPLFKMFAVYQQLKQDLIYKSMNEENNSVVKYFKDLQIDLPESQEKILKEIKLQGYRCIWYLSLCLQGDLFPYEKIPEDKQAKIVSELLSWFLYEDTLDHFFQIDTATSLQQLLLAFQSNLYNDLQKYKAILTSDHRIQNLPLSQMIIELVRKSVEKSKQDGLLGLFIFEIMELGYSINYEQFTIAIQNSFLHPYTSLYDKAMESSIDFIDSDQQGQRLQTKQKNIKEQVLIKYMNEFQQMILEDENIQKEIITQVVFVRVSAELYYFLQQYQKTIMIILNSQEYGYYVFDYIKRILHTLEDKKPFLDFILSIIAKLVNVDAEKLSNRVLIHFDEDNYKKAIEMLDSHPQLKLKLLSEIISQKRAKKELVEDNLMIGFFKLICQFHKNQVYEQLQYGDFPSDECLKICYQNNIQIGVAYLTERSGKYQEALDLYFDIVSNDLQTLILKGSNAKNDPQFLFEWIQMQIHPCIKICRSVSLEEEESMNYWFKCVIRMVNLRQQFEQQEIVFSCLNRIYQIMLEEVLERIPLQGIIQNSKLLFDSFSRIEELRRAFTKLLSFCSFELHNQEYLKKVTDLDQKHFHDELFIHMTKGKYFNPLCLTCSEQKKQSFIAYVNCQHIFHVGCIRNCNICEECSSTCSSYQLHIQMQQALENVGNKIKPKKKDNQKQLILVKNNQQIDYQEDEMTKSEKRLFKINRWKMYDIDKQQQIQEIDQYYIS